MDINIIFDPVNMCGGLGVANGDLSSGDDLLTSLYISLFSWRVANPGDLPNNQNQQGWWGDAFADVPGSKLGSRLYLLSRSKLDKNTLVNAKTYAMEALQWLIDDGAVADIEVGTEIYDTNTLVISITIYKNDDDRITYKFDNIWNMLNQ